jgi:hypothetical protein
VIPTGLQAALTFRWGSRLRVHVAQHCMCSLAQYCICMLWPFTPVPLEVTIIISVSVSTALSYACATTLRTIWA